MVINELIEQIHQLSQEEQAWIAAQVQKLIRHEISIYNGNEEDEEGEAVYTPPVGALYPYKAVYELQDIKDIIAQFPSKKKWTFTDLMDERIFPIDLKIRIEIINNKIYVMPNPSTNHQKILSLINAFVQMFVLQNNLGDVYVAPTSVKFDNDNVLEPDLIFIAVHHLDMVKEQVIEGVPDLVVEVISKSNYKKLREAKKNLYAKFGVEEYWEVYPKKKFIRIETLEENENGEKTFTTFSEGGKESTIQSKVLEGFELKPPSPRS